MPKSRQRFNPTLPDWLVDVVRRDAQELGRGERMHGGTQGVAMAALLLYLEIPEEDRRSLARTMSARDESSVRRDLDAHWTARAIRAITALGEADAAAFVQAIETRLAQKRTSGTAAAPRRESRRKSTRRQGA